MACAATRLGPGTGPRLAQACCFWAVSVVAVVAVACSHPSSDNIVLWKSTEKGPERLHEALADHGVAPRLRAEAASALVDIGRSEEVDPLLAAAPADDRAEISKTLEPTYEVAMKDPNP